MALSVFILHAYTALDNCENVKPTWGLLMSWRNVRGLARSRYIGTLCNERCPYITAYCGGRSLVGRRPLPSVDRLSATVYSAVNPSSQSIAVAQFEVSPSFTSLWLKSGNICRILCSNSNLKQDSMGFKLFLTHKIIPPHYAFF